MNEPTNGYASSDEALFDLLSGANLTAERVMMEDGYPSLRMRSAEEAAALALDTLRAADFVIVRNGEHLLHQEEDSWAMEHTVECRQRGLMECALHELACSGAWRDTAPGVYRIVDEPGLPVHLEDWP